MTMETWSIKASNDQSSYSPVKMITKPQAIILLVFPVILASAGCDQSCGGSGKLPFPFGFSAGCPIQLNCTAKGTAAVGEFTVQTVTSDSIRVNLPEKCGRPILTAGQLFGSNYAPTAFNGILLQNCSSEITGCLVPFLLVQMSFQVHDCEPKNNKTNGFNCYSEQDAGRGFIDYQNLTNSGCQSLFSAISVNEPFGNNNSAVSTDFQVVTLGWWLEGNCLCSENANCTKIKSPVNGRQAHRCRCLEGFVGDGFQHGSGCRKGGGNAKLTSKLIILLVGIGSTALVVMIFLFYYFDWKHLSKKILCFVNLGKIDDQNVEAFLKSFGSLVPKRYSYLEIKKITNSFKNKLGEGGFGGVYKGKLHDGRLVAVKLLKESKGDGEQFINEVASISRTSHINIVSLLGFCYESGKRALIFEFMVNGSLDKFISDRKKPKEHVLGLEELYKIVVGIAKGLEYLHLGCKTRILHFDIKPHNILLDENFCPKISDFGLAKQCLHKESIVSLFGTRGTIGYIAPELFSRNYGGVSYKADVYSYGMMILDMVVGREYSNDSTFDCSSEMYFPNWIYKRLEEEQEIGLHCITSEEENENARKMIIVSLWCIQTNPLSRPSMTKVLEMLEGSLHSLHIPPKPFLSSINGPLTHCATTDGITLCSSNVS